MNKNKEKVTSKEYKTAKSTCRRVRRAYEATSGEHKKEIIEVKGGKSQP